MGKRRKSRELALQALYHLDIVKEDPEALLQLFWENFSPQEEVKAFLVPVHGLTPGEVDLTEIARFASERLARFKVPRYWEARSALPLTPSQRVAKHELAEDPPPAGWDRTPS